MSVYLDKVGFFKLLATKVMKHAGTSQEKLFILLSLIISSVTIFTSNSTIVLTFTPFICYFAKNSNIDPVPFVFMAYVAANTWSMFLVIGNTTNVYIATYFGAGFMEYVRMMALPTVFAAVVSFSLLFLIFRKKLKEPLQASELEVTIRNVPALAVGVAGLGVCTVLLIISSYIGLDMWIVCLCSAGAVMVGDGVFHGGDFDVVTRLAREGRLGEGDIRFFAGYSGWSAGQLEGELREDSWLVGEVSRDEVFGGTEGLWERIMRRLGARPAIWSMFPEDPRMN